VICLNSLEADNTDRRPIWRLVKYDMRRNGMMLHNVRPFM
jgi:hypothetical protein